MPAQVRQDLRLQGSEFFFAPAVKNILDGQSCPPDDLLVTVPNRSACGRPQQPGQGSLSTAGHTDENQILRLPPQDAFRLGNLGNIHGLT